MIRKNRFALPLWSILVPPLACGVLAWAWIRPLDTLLLSLVAAALVACVIAAVHHAEVVAHKVGEPFGTLILALAVTVIEVALIVTLMMSPNAGASNASHSLARDTVFAAVMIVCNGVVGICLLAGAIRHHVLRFRVDGSAPALSVLAALVTLTLVMPSFTSTTAGPTFSSIQLVFAGVMSLVLYGVFVFVQTVRHREYFLPVAVSGGSRGDDDHAPRPSPLETLLSSGLLLISLVAVVGLAKKLAPTIESGVQKIGAPESVVGIAIAMLILLPETWAALRAAMRNRLQTSFNLALGSVLATIGLTIPAVCVVSLAFDMPIVLGLPPKEIAQLALTLLVSTITLASGRATVLQGAVHLVLFSAFLFLSVVP